MPAAPTVDTVIASSVPKGATVEIVGTDQKGPAPFTAKLEKDKVYKARVQAPGFQALELDVKGGQEKATAKLVGEVARHQRDERSCWRRHLHRRR